MEQIAAEKWIVKMVSDAPLRPSLKPSPCRTPRPNPNPNPNPNPDPDPNPNQVSDAQLNAKIDSQSGHVILGVQPPDVYQQVIEKTKGLSFRSYVLAQNIEKRNLQASA